MDLSYNTETIADDTQALKTCVECGKVLPLSQFSANNRSADGYRHRCKSCCAAHTATRLPKGAMPQTALNVKGDAESPLGAFTPRELIEELRKRGFTGELTYTYVYNVKL